MPRSTDLYAALAGQTRKELLFGTNAPPLVRLRKYFEYYAKHFESIGFREGCLLGDLGAEVSDGIEPIRARNHAAYGAWDSDVAQVNAEGIECGDIKPMGPPMPVARYLINGWEGALLRMKAEKSSAPLDEFMVLSFDVLLPHHAAKRAKKA